MKALEPLQFYKIDKKLDMLEEDQENIDEQSGIAKLYVIDIQVTSLLLHTKKAYRKLRIGEIDFLLEVSKATEIQYLQRIALKVV